jgi:hypothetical protein
MIRREFTSGLGSSAAQPVLVAFMLFWPPIIFAHDIYGTLKDGHGVSCCGDMIADLRITVSLPIV